jgi:hypothetical protein
MELLIVCFLIAVGIVIAFAEDEPLEDYADRMRGARK